MVGRIGADRDARVAFVSADDPPPPLPPVDAGCRRSTSRRHASPPSCWLVCSPTVMTSSPPGPCATPSRKARRAEVYDGLLADAMRARRRTVAPAASWTVAEEHLASQTLIRALDRIAPDLGPDGRIGPLAVLAGVAGEHHMIGLICLDHVLRELGWTVARLGADVPDADLARFVERNDARLVALTASDPARVATVAAAVEAVRAAAAGRGAGHEAVIMLGGRLAAHPGIETTVGVDWTGVTLADAARFADDEVRRLSASET